MPRNLLGLLPVVTASIFTLLMPGKAVADPPEGEQGQMVVDEVCEPLRQNRKEKDTEKRVKLLEKLAPTRDPRVAVAIGLEIEAGLVLRGDRFTMTREASTCSRLLEKHYLPLKSDQEGFCWWEKNKADLLRRAKQLPQ